MTSSSQLGLPLAGDPPEVAGQPAAERGYTNEYFKESLDESAPVAERWRLICPGCGAPMTRLGYLDYICRPCNLRAGPDLLAAEGE